MKTLINNLYKEYRAEGRFFSVIRRKLIHTLFTHHYELHILKPYWKKGRVLNVGAGRDCGRLGPNVISFDKRIGEDDYTKRQGWKKIYPDVVGDIEEGLPFDDNTFDCVMSTHLLEHTKNTQFCLHEMIRVTKPGGFICGVLPCVAGNGIYNYWKDSTHTKSWSRYDFLHWLAQNHFFDKVNVIQYCEMKLWLNPWSFDFVLQKKRRYG